MREMGLSYPWFYRPEQGRLVVGVCAGLAQALKIDVTLVRLAFLLLGLASGLGALGYFLLWLFAPSSSAQLVSGAVGEVIRHNANGFADELARMTDSLAAAWAVRERGDWPHPLSRRWIALLLIAVGTVVLLWSLGLFAWLTIWRAIGIAAVTIGAGLLLTLAPRWRE